MNKRVLVLLVAALGCSGGASVIVNSGSESRDNRRNEEQETNRNGFSEQSLFDAVMDGDIDEVRRNLIGGNVDPNSKDTDGNLLIVQAIKLGKEKIAEELAEKTKIKERYSEDKDPFIQAVVKGYSDLAILLLDKYESPREYFYMKSDTKNKRASTFEKSFLYYVLTHDCTDRSKILEELAKKSEISSITSLTANSDMTSIVYTTRYIKLIDELGVMYSDISSDKDSASTKLKENDSKIKEKIRHAIQIAKKFNKLTSAKYPSEFKDGKPLMFFLILTKNESNLKMLAPQIYKENELKQLHDRILQEVKSIFSDVYNYWKGRDIQDLYYSEASNTDDQGYSLTNGTQVQTPPAVNMSRHPSLSQRSRPNIRVDEAASANTSPNDKKKGVKRVKSKVKNFFGFGKSKVAEDIKSEKSDLEVLSIEENKNNSAIYDVDVINGKATYMVGGQLYSSTTKALEEESISREGSRNASPASSPIRMRKTGRPRSNSATKGLVPPTTVREEGSSFQRPKTRMFVEGKDVSEMFDTNQLLSYIDDKMNSYIPLDIARLDALSKQFVDLMVKDQISIEDIQECFKTNKYKSAKKDIVNKLISKANALAMPIVDYSGNKYKCTETAKKLRTLL